MFFFSLNICRVDIYEKHFSTRSCSANESLISCNASKNDSVLMYQSHIFHINYKVLLSGSCPNKIIHHKKILQPPPPPPAPPLRDKIKMWMDGIIAWLQSAGYWAAFSVEIATLWGVFFFFCYIYFFLHKCGMGGWKGWFHSPHGANPTLMPKTDPPGVSLAGRRMCSSVNLLRWHCEEFTAHESHKSWWK